MPVICHMKSSIMPLLILALGLSTGMMTCSMHNHAFAANELREVKDDGPADDLFNLDSRFQEYSASASRYFERGEQATFANISSSSIVAGKIHGLYGPSAFWYVNGAKGTDAPGFGSYTGFQAYSSLDYAWENIPANYSGNQFVHVAPGEYSGTHVFFGKSPTGNYTITISGTLRQTADITGTGGEQGSGATQGTVTGAFTAGAYDNMLLYCYSGANAGSYRVIDSTSASAITIVGTWPNGAPVVGDGYYVYEWATRFKGGNQTFVLTNGQKGVYFSDLGLETTATTALYATGSSGTQLTRCSVTRLTQVDMFGSITYSTCVVRRNNGANGRVCQITGPGLLKCNYTKIDCVTTGGVVGVYVDGGGYASLYGGCVIEGAGSGGKGIEVVDNGSVQLFTTTVAGMNKIRNFTTGYGIHATYNGGVGKVSGYVVYIGNSTDTYTSNGGFIH